MGCNKPNSPAVLKTDLYPEYSGRHAEMHVWLNAAREGVVLNGGTLYVIGVRKNRRRTMMSNTRPCGSCRELIRTHMRFRYVVYIRDGVLVKEPFNVLMES